MEFRIQYLSVYITPNKSNSKTIVSKPKSFIWAILKSCHVAIVWKDDDANWQPRRCWQCPLLSHSKSSDQRNEDSWPDIAIQAWIMQRWQGSTKESRLLWEVQNIWFAWLGCKYISQFCRQTLFLGGIYNECLFLTIIPLFLVLS